MHRRPRPSRPAGLRAVLTSILAALAALAGVLYMSGAFAAAPRPVVGAGAVICSTVSSDGRFNCRIPTVVPTATPTPTISPSASPTASPTPLPTTTAPPTTTPPVTTTPPATTPPVTTVPPTTPPVTTPPPSPTPSPSTSSPPPPGSSWPDASNTGVPAGVTLTAYSGPCTITAPDTVIDSRTVDCDLIIHTTGVIIRNSRINGQINSVEESLYSFSLIDSEVNAGLVQEAAVGTTHMTILRSEITGGITSVYCYADCDIRDSWLHGQRIAPNSDWHVGAFLANDDGDGSGTNATLEHNTILCEVAPTAADGGCSGDINLYGDFGQINGVTIDDNYMGANPGISYCVYGGDSSTKPYPHAANVKITNNIIARGSTGRCGNYGPVAGFNVAGVGNVWSGNVWDDGGTVAPAD